MDATGWAIVSAWLVGVCFGCALAAWAFIAAGWWRRRREAARHDPWDTCYAPPPGYSGRRYKR